MLEVKEGVGRREVGVAVKAREESCGSGIVLYLCCINVTILAVMLSHEEIPVAKMFVRDMTIEGKR